jgi:hypothetical protein
MPSSIEKWPVEIKVVKMASSSLGQQFNLYFVSGVMNQEQCNTLREKLPLISEFIIETGQVVVATLVNQQQLMNTYEEFCRLAKGWRGQYYALTNRFVEACKEVIEA